MSEIGWFPLILLSACSLGFYDFSKKHAVMGNRVMPVLFLATLSGTLFMLLVTACTGHFTEYLCCSWQEACWIIGKSIIVTAGLRDILHCMTCRFRLQRLFAPPRQSGLPSVDSFSSTSVPNHCSFWEWLWFSRDTTSFPRSASARAFRSRAAASG